MSTTIDNKVVEMRFDNRNFESNVKTTMSTLDKLKHALKLDGVAKSFDGITAASKKVNMSGLQNGVETVRASFSALDVVAVTALANITNSALNAGKRIVSALTIEPVTTGLQEYETQINAVQTILANTQKEGTNIKQVNAALDELNEYADLTIYNFTEMTKNIGTFTAAGVGLKESVQAIKGISNLAALSGSTSQQASTAMYQLSQALAAGKVSLMDWNSVVNAGMGGQVFQDALTRTARTLGTGVDEAIEKYGTFRESLTKGNWLTTEVLTETLAQLSGAYTEAELISQGYTKEQAADILKLAETATDAATKVKTFTQMWDVLKETAQSGWAQTWRLIFGDFEQAKSLFTPLTNFFSGIIQSFSDARNSLLESTLGKTFSGLAKTVTGALEPIQKVTDGVSSAVETITDLGAVVDDVILGKFGNGADRFKALTDASINYYEVQNKVNEKLGDSYRYTQDQIDAQNKALGIQTKVVASTEQGVEATTKLTDAQKTQLKELSKLSDAQMRSKGYTEEQIAAFRELGDMAKKLGMPIDEFIDRIDELDGRMILLESFGNIIESISKVAKSIGGAFREVFKPITSDQLFDAIAGFHRFTEALIMSDDNLEKLKRTFKGIFGVINIFTSLIGGGLGLAFKILVNVLEKFDLNLLDVAATIGDALYAFSDFITFGETFEKVFSNIGDILDTVTDHVSNFIESITGINIKDSLSSIGGIRNVPGIKQIVDSLEWMYNKLSGYAESFAGLDFASGIKKILDDAANAFKNFITFMKSLTWNDVLNALTKFGEKVRENFKKLKEDFEEIGPDLIEGLQNGLKDNFEKAIEWMKEIGEKIIEAIKAVLGIHSPSTVMFEIGQNIVQGLINGISSLIGGVADIFRGLGDAITEAIGPIDWGAVGVAIFGAGMFVTLYKFTDALQGFASAAKNVTAPAAGIGKVATSISEAIDIFANNPNFKGGTKLQNMAKAFETFAKSIAILATAVGALALLDPKSLWNAVGVIGALALIMGALTAALSKVADSNKSMKVLDTINIGGIILSLAAAFVLLGVAAKIMGTVDAKALENAQQVLLTFGAVLAALTVATKFAGSDFDKTAALISKVGFCFILLGVAARLMGGMDDTAFNNATRMLLAFAASVGVLIASTQWAGNNIDKAAKFVTKVGVAFLLLSATAKIMGGMSHDEMLNASIMLGVFGVIVGGLVAITGLFGHSVDKASDFILKVSGAFALLAIAAKILGSLEPGEMLKAGAALIALGVVVGLLIALTNLAPKGAIAKVSATLIAMSLAIGILAGISVLLSFVKTENLFKGIAAVATLSLLMSMMTFATRGATDIKGTMIGIAIAIGVMAAAIAALSFIDPAKLAGATMALATVMAMLALVVSQSGKAAGAMKELIAISAAIVVIGGVLYLLAGLPTESVLGSALSLSAVLMALATACKILDTVGKVSTNALVAMGVLTLVVGGLAGIFGLMSYFGVEAALPSAIALSAVLLAMSAACVILGTIGTISPMALAAMGVLTAVVAGLAIILGLMSAFDVTPSIETAAALSIMLLGMSAAMVILSALGPMAVGAIAAAGSLAAVLGILAGVVIAAGAIKQIPGVDWLVSEGGEFLQKIGEAIGKFIGGFVGGVLDGLTDNLVAVADNLSNFIMHLMPFLVGVKMIDPSMQTAIDSLVGMILSLTASSFITGVADLLGISTDFGDLGDKLVPFGEAMQRYSKAIQGIDAGAIQASATAGEALANLANTLPKSGGLAQAIFGETTGLDDFGTQLVAFGTAIKAYSDVITGIDAGAIQASATAGQALSDLASTLPKQDGLSQAIFGTTEGLDTFGGQLKSFGEGLKGYSDSVTDLKVEPIQQSVAAATALNELAGQLGSEGGVLAFFTGENKGLDTFGGELKSFGGALKSYSDSLSEVNFTSITTATNKAKQLADFAKVLVDIDYTGVSNFNKIKGIGTALKNYYDKISGVDLGKISSSISSVQSIVNSINNMADINLANIVKFQAAIALLGTTDLDSVISAFEGAGTRAFQAGLNFVTMLANGFTAGTGTVQRAAAQVLAIVLKSINSTEKLFTVSGTLLANGIASGISKGKVTVDTAVRSLVRNAASILSSYYGSFKTAGYYVASGFAAGISRGSFSATIAARAMANAAVSAARTILQINSPSKVFRKIGAGVPEGFAQGIDRFSYLAKNSAVSMADDAVSSTSKVLSGLTDMLSVDADMDLNPVITPVLDLDNVKSGAGLISTMLSSTAPVSVLRSVNSINRRMNLQNQNGATNNDVVNSINKLRKDLGDLDRNTYVVEGITYSDGTAVASAVQDLTRAIRIERRV